jgi:hypothetical protein
MVLRVCGGGIPQDHYYTLRACLDDEHEGSTLGKMFDPVTRNAAWARRGKGCSRRCGVTCRGEVQTTAITTTLAWIWRVGGVTAGVQVCTYGESCMRVCFLGIHGTSIAPTNSPPTDPGHFAESRVDLQHPCCGAATHEAWPGSCCSACHTLDTAGLLARRAVGDLPARGETAVGSRGRLVA